MLDTSLIAEIESKAPKLSRTDREALIACLTTRVKRHEQRLFYALYPDEDEIWRAPANKHFNPGSTVYARRLYPKLLEFFRAGRPGRPHDASGTARD